MLGEKTAYLVWGVTNDTHEVVGTTFNYHQDVKNEPLEHYLSRKVSPDIGFEFVTLTMYRKRIVVLIIPAATKVPTSFDNTNRNARAVQPEFEYIWLPVAFSKNELQPDQD